MTLNRRQFTHGTLAAGAWTLLGARLAYGRTLEPQPDFSLDGDNRFVAGIRPFREGTFRLEAEVVDGRYLIHNYGYGGAGITLSWGAAHEARDLVLARDGGRRVAVLGAGVIGLTVATLLKEADYDVTVYAKGFLEETTSHVAGGQFNPSTVEFGNDENALPRFQGILRRAFRTHESKIGQGFGVSRRPNYLWNRSRTFDLIPRDCVPEPEVFSALPFAHHENRPGVAYQTLLIEPPLFLRRLELDLRLAGVRLIRKTFDSLEHVLGSVDQEILVNCLGLGAGVVMNDAAVVPVRGQLVLLKPQTQLAYLYGGHGYIFPRSDAVVVGGSFERGVDDPTPDPARCAEILQAAAAPFQGMMQRPAPAWMSEP